MSNLAIPLLIGGGACCLVVVALVVAAIFFFRSRSSVVPEDPIKKVQEDLTTWAAKPVAEVTSSASLPTEQRYKVYTSTNFAPGKKNDIGFFEVSADECRTICNNRSDCKGFTTSSRNTQGCWLKKNVSTCKKDSGHHSFLKPGEMGPQCGVTPT